MTSPQFPTIFRGYDPAAVDGHLASSKEAMEALRAEVDEVRNRLQQATGRAEELEAEVARQRALVAAFETQQDQAEPPSFAHLGERVGAILGLAQEEADSIRASAGTEVDEHRRLAEEAASSVRDAAERYAEEVRERADREAADVLARAQATSDTLLDEAERESLVRREESEAHFEAQRAKAAAAAADFERTLQQRRTQAGEEFALAQAGHQQRLAELEERAEQLAVESEEGHRARTAEADAILERARAEAVAVVEAAKEQAERVRRDSERELAAATARRDSITDQLSNVRSMLATLGGAAALEHLGGAADSHSAPADVTDEEDALFVAEPESERVDSVQDDTDGTDDPAAGDPADHTETETETAVELETEPEPEPAAR